MGYICTKIIQYGNIVLTKAELGIQSFVYHVCVVPLVALFGQDAYIDIMSCLRNQSKSHQLNVHRI